MSALKFGKYKGFPLDYVLGLDPSYVVWLQSKGLVKLTKQQKDLLDEYERESDYYSALEGYGHDDWN